MNLRSPPDIQEAILLTQDIHDALVGMRALDLHAGRAGAHGRARLADLARMALEALNGIADPVGIGPKVVDFATARNGRGPEPPRVA